MSVRKLSLADSLLSVRIEGATLPGVRKQESVSLINTFDKKSLLKFSIIYQICPFKENMACPSNNYKSFVFNHLWNWDNYLNVPEIHEFKGTFKGTKLFYNQSLIPY